MVKILIVRSIFSLFNPFHCYLICIVGECGQRINDVRARLPRQQDLIRTRRSQKQRLEEEARRLRAEADSAAIRGQCGMQLGLGNNSRRLLEEGEIRRI